MQLHPSREWTDTNGSLLARPEGGGLGSSCGPSPHSCGIPPLWGPPPAGDLKRRRYQVVWEGERLVAQPRGHGIGLLGDERSPLGMEDVEGLTPVP